MLQALIRRDGPRCVWCGREFWPEDLTLEHLLPRTRGGRRTPENLAVACRRCNRARATSPVAAFARQRLDAGMQPQLDRLGAQLARLAGSRSRAQAAYGQRQLELLGRIAARPR